MRVYTARRAVRQADLPADLTWSELHIAHLRLLLTLVAQPTNSTLRPFVASPVTSYLIQTLRRQREHWYLNRTLAIDMKDMKELGPVSGQGGTGLQGGWYGAWNGGIRVDKERRMAEDNLNAGHKFGAHARPGAAAL